MKRIISAALCAVLVFSTFSISIFAWDWELDETDRPPSDVVSITAQYKGTVVQNNNGYWNTDSKGEEYFHYYIYHKDLYLTVKFNDERGEVSGTFYDFYSGKLSHYVEGMMVSINDYQKTNHWTPDKINSFEVQIDTVYTTVSLNIKAAAGDVTGDGSVNTVDLMYMKRIMSGAVFPTESQGIAADMSGDGTINTVDLALLKRLLVGSVQ